MKAQHSFSSGLRALFFLTVLLLLPPGLEPLFAQDQGTLRVEENLRAEPQGTIIGRLAAGSPITVVRQEGRWVQVELEGWIWTRSLQITDRGMFDLMVSASPDENLRAEPSGTVLARLLEGALLEEMETVPGWTRVRRVAWVWGPSMVLPEGRGAGRTPEAETPGEPRPPAADPTAGPTWWRSGSTEAPILAGPDGDTLAMGRPGVELRVLARQGNWARVQLDGWVWAPEGAPTDSTGERVISDLNPADVLEDPEAYRGRVVSWELQFVSREEAERVRTDFYEGEPFLLTRAPSSEQAFVYVAVPPERLAEVEGLTPLERIHVVGRIRTGSAALTGNPILDLLELTRHRRPG